jgi:UDP-N-acetylglucosamine--N-acetylmuramyl-(pentapeptide) pyrophosphoryl-undecaprenol N-acetylglucosamine transferase
MIKIVLTGGGTGGHLFPLIAVSRKLRERMGDRIDFLFIGTGSRLEKELMEQDSIPDRHVKAGKYRRYFSFKNFLDFFKVPVGIIQSLWILLWYMPDAILSKGGYASVPVVLAARFYRIPVLVHESDAIPGLANRFLAKFASLIGVSYHMAEKYFPAGRTAMIGNPVREEILNGDPIAARAAFHFTESKPVILVMGGSQGAKVINDAISKILPKLLLHAQVIHQTGNNNYDEVVHLAGSYGIKAGREGYYPVRFLSDEGLRNAYAITDIVVSRAGANSIAEIAANGKASILIPLFKSAGDHQRMNAYELARVGATMVLEETNLGENILLQKIEKIFSDEELKKMMEEKIKVFYHPEAIDHLAQGLINIATE